MMRKPPEITDDEWESLTSPENYYRDGEVSRAQADAIFRDTVSRLVAQRRGGAPASMVPTPRGKQLHPTNAAAVSRVLNGARISGLRVVTAPSRKSVIVQGSAIPAAVRTLRSKGYVFTINTSSLTVTGRYA